MRGVLHIHSDFSHDGKHSIAEIAAWARGEALDFVVLTEHDRTFSQTKFEDLVAECQAQSREVLIIPGIEYSFSCEGRWIHTNVVGIDRFLDNDTDFEKLSTFLDDVHARGGVSILNHPGNVMHLVSDDLLARFDLFEGWNTGHDHRYAPRSRILKLRGRCRGRESCIASSDIHALPEDDYVVLHLTDYEGEADERRIVSTLGRGLVYAVYRRWTVMSSGRVSTRRAWMRLLPTISTLHERAVDVLRIAAHALDYQPPHKLAR